MTALPLLSKSNYVDGCFCVKKLWLSRFRPEERPPLSDAGRDRMATGQVVQELARRRFPGGVMAWEPGIATDEAAAQTRQLVSDGCECILEATLIADGCLARVDVLQRLSDGGWSVQEIKSSTVKDVKQLQRQITDVSFQAYVAERSSLRVDHVGLLLIDSKYQWQGGDYDPFGLLKPVDVTAEWQEQAEDLPAQVERLKPYLTAPDEPQAETNLHCDKCDFHAYCHREQPAHDVALLPGIKARQVTELRQLGYATIDLIPDDLEKPQLADQAWRAREVVRTGRPYVSDGLSAALEQIRMPSAFIDFESCQDALPRYPGERPYAQVCFQWSAHLLDAPDGEATHQEFLYDRFDDPRRAFCESLWSAVRDYHSIVHYHSFEKTQVSAMAKAGAPFAKELDALLHERGVDLEKIVKEHVYLAEFGRKTSIKQVLPALVPHLSYDGLALKQGDDVSVAFRELQAPETSPERRAELREALLRYCELDTLAMVEVYRVLRRLAARG